MRHPFRRCTCKGHTAYVTSYGGAQDIGSPQKIIKGFGPELFGRPIEDEDILDVATKELGSLTYYQGEKHLHLGRIKHFRAIVCLCSKLIFAVHACCPPLCTTQCK